MKEGPKPEEKGKRIAVVRIKGAVSLKKGIKDTFQMLNLPLKNSCVVLDATPTVLGMVKKVKDFVTWGEVNKEAEKLLDGRKEGNKKFFRLNSPRRGFGRKGTKVPFNVGGGLGYRKDKINDLIRRMV